MKSKFEKLKKMKLFQQGGRAAYLYPNYIFCSRAFKEHPLWANDHPVFSYCINHKLNWFYAAFDDSEFDKTLEKVIEDNLFLKKSEDKLSVIPKEAKEEFQSIDLKSISNDELFSIYQRYLEHYQNIGIAPTFLRQVDLALAKRLERIFEGKDNSDELIAIVSYPTKRTYSRQEDIAILELAWKALDKKINSDELEKGVKKIWQDFRTSSLGYFDEKPKTLSYFKERLEEEMIEEPGMKLEKIISEEREHSQKKEEIKKNLNEKDKRIVDIVGMVIYVKDHYKFMVNKLQDIGEPIFEEIAKRTNKDRGFIKDLLKEEISSLLSGRTLDEEKIKERTGNYLILQDESGADFLIGKEAEEFENELLRIDQNQKEFRGRSACKGYGKGTARIVLSLADFDKMNSGDILVVMNTSPDFVPIMKRAVAIVAEEGGITGHVSVVSREFNIPAVVGIGAITRIIKDGDLVEVDAGNGIVKILNSK